MFIPHSAAGSTTQESFIDNALSALGSERSYAPMDLSHADLDGN